MIRFNTIHPGRPIQCEYRCPPAVLPIIERLFYPGHDTTAAAMSWALHLIGTHKDVQRKLHEEIDKVFDDKNDGTNLTMEDIKKFEYLDRVIKESLRLFPSVPIFGRRTTSECR